MITRGMPAVIEQSASDLDGLDVYLPNGDNEEKTWMSDDNDHHSFAHEAAGLSILQDECQKQTDSPIVDPDCGSGLPPVSIDSAQHLLQSISSDDDGSRSPSPIRKSPVPATGGYSPDHSHIPDADLDMVTPRSPSPVTLDDICQCDATEISSLISRLDIRVRHQLINHAIKRFSYEMLLSLTSNAKFLSEIHLWCHDAFQSQNTALLEDILLFLELLPAFDAASDAPLFKIFVDFKAFTEDELSFLSQRILKRWASVRSRTLNQPVETENASSANADLPLQSIKGSSASCSSRPNRLPPNPKSNNFRNRRNPSYVQPNNFPRRSSPAQISPRGSAVRRDGISERSPGFSHQRSPHRSPSPRANSGNAFDHSSLERRSDNGYFSRNSENRGPHTNSRYYDSNSAYSSRSESDYDANRSSSQQYESARDMPSSSVKQLYRERRVDTSNRFEPSLPSRQRDFDKLSSVNASHSFNIRDQTKHGIEYSKSHPEKGYYRETDNRLPYSQSSISNSSGKHGKIEFDRPRDPTPVQFRSGMQDSRNSKRSYDGDYSRSQRQPDPVSYKGRSISPPASRPRSPTLYRDDLRVAHDDERIHFSDHSRDQRRYSGESSSKQDIQKNYRHDSSFRNVAPITREDFRDTRRTEYKDDRQSEIRDYRRDLIRDSREDESRAFKRNETTRDFKNLNVKRKSEFRYDAPNKSLRLSDEERRELVQKGACLYCRKSGHTIENCRTRPARSS